MMMMETEEPARASGGNCCYLCNQCSSSFASLPELESHLATHNHPDGPEAAGEGEDPTLRRRPGDENSPSSSDTSFHIDEGGGGLPSTGQPEEEEEAVDGPLSPLEEPEPTDPAERKPTFPCRFCSKLFTSRSLLNIHYTHTHRDKPQYECEDCGRIFSVKRELATHRRIHSGEQTHACAQCGKEFGTRQLLKKHWMWHTGQRSHVCPHCGKAFFQKGHLTQHLMIHAGGRPHVCQLCNKTFIFKFDLNRHMKIHAERGYACSKCGKAFLKEATLLDHQNKCTGENPVRTPGTPSGTEPPSPASPARSNGRRSVPAVTPLDRKLSVGSLKSEMGLNQPAPPPVSMSTAPLPLFPPQLVPPPQTEPAPGGGQRVVCLLCMQDFPSQAAYSLHLSYVHLREAMFSSFQQQQAQAAANEGLKGPALLSAALRGAAGSPVIRRASDSAVLGNQLPPMSHPPLMPPPMNGGHPGPGVNGIRPEQEHSRPPTPDVTKQEPVDESPAKEEEEEEETLHLVPGCSGCGETGPRLAKARSQIRELEATARLREAELTRLREKMGRVGAIAGSLLESCSEFDKLWMLHSKKVYSQIQAVLNSLD